MAKRKTSRGTPTLERIVRVKHPAAAAVVVLLAGFAASWLVLSDRTGSWIVDDRSEAAPTTAEVSDVGDLTSEVDSSGGQMVVAVDEAAESGQPSSNGQEPDGISVLDGFGAVSGSGDGTDGQPDDGTDVDGDDQDPTTESSESTQQSESSDGAEDNAAPPNDEATQPAGPDNKPNSETDTTSVTDDDRPNGSEETDGTEATATTRPPPDDPTTSTTISEKPAETPETPTGGNTPESLAGRLYNGWCPAGASSTSAGGAIIRVAAGGSIQSAIDQAASNGGGIVEISGRHTISRPIELRSGVVLRGTGGAAITTGQNMDNMVQFGGGFGGSSTATVTGGNAFSRSFTFNGSLGSGYYIIGDQSRGQLVRVTSINGNTANIELPLVENFNGLSISPQRDLLTRAGLESLKLEPQHRVRDLIEIRSTRHSWVRDVTTNGAGGQTKAAVYLRQAYRVSVIDNTFSNAAEHGDGGQGYGINIANNSSSSLIANNKLRLFRHSILLQGAAAGNVVRSNDSDEPRHPNFVQGGPADISFHNYASANLVFANTVTRIQINDAGRTGPHNAMLFNTLRTGPLTLDYGVNDLTLIGNKMNGSVGDLRSRMMPSLNTNSTAGNPSPERAFWTLDYDPFAGPGGDSRTSRGRGILDWGSGDNVYVDESADYFNPCG